jgi:hypothetical protein
MAYLFLHGPEDHRHPAPNRGLHLNEQTQPIERADSFVVLLFAELQAIWRRQGTLRRTFYGMPTSHQEHESWERLIRYLVNLPPPKDH